MITIDYKYEYLEKCDGEYEYEYLEKFDGKYEYGEQFDGEYEYVLVPNLGWG